MSPFALLWSLALAQPSQPAQPAARYDLLIRGGTVLDGTGAPGFRADVAVNGDRIALVSRQPLAAGSARRVIDATGKVVSPGFIDLHAHQEAIFRLPAMESRVRQGVTTALGGPDGGGPYPFGEYLERAAKEKLGINVAWLIGFGTIRRAVLGQSARKPTEEELARMKWMVGEAMQQGAFGLSTGLFYVPQTYATTEEVIALAKVAADSGGFYTSHLRKEGIGLLEGVAEAIRIAREARIPVVLTHHKVIGRAMWGQSVKTLALIDSARRAGLDVSADQYPYTASSTGFGVLVPAWAMEDGDEAFAKRVKDRVLRDSVVKGIIWILENDRGGGDLRRVQFASVSWKPELNGKTLYDWAVERRVPTTSTGGAPLVIEGVLKGGASMVYHVMDEDDVQRIMQHRWTAIASDGALSEPGPTVPHPRNYGTFPRVLGRYARELKVLTLPEAVRKMTALPAARLGLTDRGKLETGLLADLVVFDPATVGDKATFAEPHQYSVGIDYVIVNGQVTVDAGKLTEARAGRVLRHIPKRGPVAFLNVNVIPLDRERVLTGQTVVVEGEKITGLGPAGRVEIPAGAVRVNGAGKYLIPGLGEMHAHIPPQENADSEITRTLALWALNGVTTIRGMLGAPRHLYYRDLARRGEILSPRIWTSGPSFNGNSAPSADSAARMVRSQHALGYDFLKIHPGLSREAFDSLAAVAASLGIRFAGHVPLAVGLPRALEARYWSVDHLDGFLEATAKGSPPAKPEEAGFFGLGLLAAVDTARHDPLAEVDTARMAALVAAARRAAVWVTPTEAFIESVTGEEPLEQLFDREELRWVARPPMLNWLKATRDLREAKGNSRDVRQAYIALRRKLLKALHDGGVGIALGSDAPQFWNAPGFSLNRELAVYVSAGLTPYEALLTGTRNIARFLGNEAEAGTIAVGKRADLILLEANPLQDIKHLARKAGVMLGGRWLAKDEIERQLKLLILR